MISISSLCVFFLLLKITLCTWTKPVTVFETSAAPDDIYIGSVYYDPVFKVTHIMYIDSSKQNNHYAAVAKNGTILYRQTYNNRFFAWKGLVKGENGGKHLFMTYNTYIDSHPADIGQINFTESFDGGKTWAKSITVPPNDSKGRYLGDMLVIEETGRVFIFYECEDEIKMVSRPPGSTTFTNEISLFGKLKLEADPQRVTYNFKGKDQLLHIFYVQNGELYHSKSSDNGVNWKIPKLLGKHMDHRVQSAVANSKVSDNIIFGFFPKQRSMMHIMMTKDFGETFTDKIPVSHNPTSRGYNSYGMSLCGKRGDPLLVTFGMTSFNVPEYSWWKADDLSRTPKKHPFSTDETYKFNLDCKDENDLKPGKQTVALAVLIKSAMGVKLQLTYEEFETSNQQFTY